MGLLAWTCACEESPFREESMESLTSAHNSFIQ